MTGMNERYEAAARELGEVVVGLLVMRNGWAIMVGYDDEAEEWNAVSEVVVHKGSQVTAHECEGRGASPSTAVERCVFHLERVTS